MPTHERLGTDDREGPQGRRKSSVQLDEEPAIIVGEPDPALHLTAQNDQLMPECRILCLSRPFDLNGEANTARTKQSSANIMH